MSETEKIITTVIINFKSNEKCTYMTAFIIKILGIALLVNRKNFKNE